MPLNKRQVNRFMSAVKEKQRSKEPKQFEQQRRRATAQLYRSPLEQRASLRRHFPSVTLTYVEAMPLPRADFIGNWLKSMAAEDNC